MNSEGEKLAIVLMQGKVFVDTFSQAQGVH